MTSAATALPAPSDQGPAGLRHRSVRVVARTLPGKQFEVGRELRARIASALLEAGITVASGLDAAPPTAAN